jgi:Coenzyme PQQ synthesis protein D (PqqD)
MSRNYLSKPGLIETELDQELILLDPETQEMFSLNGTGRWVWRGLPDRSAGELAQELATHFGLTADEARADVDEMVAELLEAGLIRDLPE